MEPEVLPGSRAVLFVAANAEDLAIRVLRLDEGTEITLIENGYQPKFLMSGHLLFTREGIPMIVRFDPLALEIEGTPVPIPLNAAVDAIETGDPKLQMAVSRNGTLVYAPAAENTLRSSRFVWVNRQGVVEKETKVPLTRPLFDLFPDGRRALVADMQGSTCRVQVLDLERWTLDPLWSTRQLYLHGALLSPDGSIIHSRVDIQGGRLMLTDMTGNVSRELAHHQNDAWLAPTSVTADNASVAYMTGSDIWVVDTRDVAGETEPVAFVKSPAHDWGGEFSPDGRWMAYVSNVTGKEEIYLKRYPDGELQQPVSKKGGECPMWAPDGSEIYYQQIGMQPKPDGEWQFGSRIMAVSVTTEPELRLSEPRLLFEGPYASCTDGGAHGYDISPDGSRFLMVSYNKDPESTDELIVVLNWFEELKRLAPTGNN
jgi:serine/threonine-protein kinase